MNPPLEGPAQGKRPVLLTGLGVVLALLVALGLYAAQSLSGVSRAGTLIARDYFRESERLERVRTLLSSGTGAVRDCLLDSDASTLAGHREKAKALWAQAMSAVEDYRRVAPSGRGPLIDQLISDLSSYWEVADRSLAMESHQRSESATKVLLALVPLRDKFLATINDLGARDRVDLRSTAASTARFAEGVEMRLWTAIAVTVLLSLLVAGATVRYLTRLENTASAQYQTSVKAGVELESLSRRLLTLQDDEQQQIPSLDGEEHLQSLRP